MFYNLATGFLRLTQFFFMEFCVYTIYTTGNSKACNWFNRKGSLHILTPPSSQYQVQIQLEIFKRYVKNVSELTPFVCTFFIQHYS